MKRFLKLSFVQTTERILLALMVLAVLVNGIHLLIDNEFRGTFLDVGTIREAITKLLPWAPFDMFSPNAITAFGAVCVLLPLFWFATRIMNNRMEQGLIGKGSLGEDIQLTPEAVERTVVREVREEVPEVIRITGCRAAQGRGSAKVTLWVTITDRSTVPEVQKKTRAVVRATLSRIIGYSDDTQIRVVVSEIAGARAPKPGQRKVKRRREAGQREGAGGAA